MANNTIALFALICINGFSLTRSAALNILTDSHKLYNGVNSFVEQIANEIRDGLYAKIALDGQVPTQIAIWLHCDNNLIFLIDEISGTMDKNLNYSIEQVIDRLKSQVAYRLSYETIYQLGNNQSVNSGKTKGV